MPVTICSALPLHIVVVRFCIADLHFILFFSACSLTCLAVDSPVTGPPPGPVTRFTKWHRLDHLEAAHPVPGEVASGS